MSILITRSIWDGHRPGDQNVECDIISHYPMIKKSLQWYRRWLSFNQSYNGLGMIPVTIFREHLPYQWEFQDPKMEVPTIYFWPIFQA